MGRKVYVVGVGMTKFEKPGAKDWDYPAMAKEAGNKALADAGITFDKVEQACVGYCYGDSTCGERAVYEIGMTGIPIYNVNNNCSTGSTALFMAKQFIAGGIADCVMALGFEKMEKGSLGIKYNDRTNPMDKHFGLMVELRGFAQAPAAPQIFGNAGREHMDRYGTKPEQFAMIGQKYHKHSVKKPYSQCRDNNLQKTAVEVVGMAMATDLPSSFTDRSCIKLVGFDMSRKAADAVYAESGLGPEDADVVELHDCFSANELITYEALRLCPEGKGGEFIASGAATYGGKTVVNPSGGLISKGHPLGATGLAQCAELNWQIRGQADKRQVPGAKVGLQHNLGLGGAGVVAMYRRASF